jgi:hypothetical protein
MSEGLAVIRTSQAGGGKFLSKLPMPSGCLEMVSLPLPHVSSHSFFRTAQFMTQFVLVHFLLADANILPRTLAWFLIVLLYGFLSKKRELVLLIVVVAAVDEGGNIYTSSFHTDQKKLLIKT